MSWIVTAAQIVAGVVLPLICFLMSFPLRPDWQSGRLGDYAALLLQHRPALPLYPFLLYSIVCLILVLRRSARYREMAWVRFGIFSGGVLALEYWLVFETALGHGSVIFSVFAPLVPWGAWKLLGAVVPKKQEAIVLWVVMLSLIPIVIPPLFFVIPAICLWCAPPWAAACYLAVSWELVRERGEKIRFSLAQLLAAMTWFAAHCSAWRWSFLWMLEEYARLPAVEPERCFVCTAAARGHNRVVGGETYLAPDGRAHRVTDQLRALKAFELLLRHTTPRGHRRCRRMYDRLGPRLAAMLVHPLFADAAYLLLKPAEWMARACLALVLRREIVLVRGLYRNDGFLCRRGGAETRTVRGPSGRLASRTESQYSKDILARAPRFRTPPHVE